MTKEPTADAATKEPTADAATEEEWAEVFRLENHRRRLDKYAIPAMAGMLANIRQRSGTQIVTLAYDLAEKMLAEREKRS